jgi:hypothetical protein
LPWHDPLEQSPFAAQVFPAAHGGQRPPQSTSVSEPFVTRSVQLEGWQVEAEQTPLWQSPPPVQAFPSGQRGQTPPPQSTAVSAPFFTPSAQLATWQVPEEQTPLGQSLPPTHSTQAPAPSHIVPPPMAQAVPAAAFTWEATPAVQTPSRQGVPVDGLSAPSLATTTWPAPSHWFDLQSPETGSETLVPVTLAVSPHWPPTQVAATHGPDGAGQVVGSVQTGALLELEPPQAARSRRRRAARRAAGLECSMVLLAGSGAGDFRPPSRGDTIGCATVRK